MPRPTRRAAASRPARGSLPGYRRHRASGQALVTLCGHDVYLGPHGSEVSRREYDRVIAEFLAAGRRWPPVTPESAALTIDELILRYWVDHATKHYVKHGAPTAEQNITRAGQAASTTSAGDQREEKRGTRVRDLRFGN